MVAAGLGDGHDIEGPVQPAVAAAVQPVPLDAARGGRDRGGAVGGGELVPVPKAAHITHLPKDPSGDQRTHAMHLDQRGAHGLDQVPDPSLELPDLGVQAVQLVQAATHQLGAPPTWPANSRRTSPVARWDHNSGSRCW
jgi:hypothetical protein